MKFCLSSVALGFSKIPLLQDYKFKETDIRYISFIIFTLITIGMLAIPVPNFFLIGSQLALWLSIFYIDHCLFWGDWDLRATDGLVPVVLGTFVTFLIIDTPKSKNKNAYISIGLIGGILPVFRQTASFIFLLSFLGILAALFLLHTTRQKFKDSSTQIILQKLIWTVASFATIRIIIVVICSFIFLHEFSLKPTIQHGSGQPLLCGLGYAENPYNLAWEDDNANVNYMLFYDEAESLTNSWANDLSKTFRIFVLQDPLLLLKNIAQKFMTLNSYIFSAKLNAENELDIVAVSPKKFHLAIYLLSALSFFTLSTYFIVRRNIKMRSAFVFLSIAVITTASSAGPLIVFPGYYASFIGLLYSLVFILIPLFIILEKGFYPPWSETINNTKAVKYRVAFLISLFSVAISGFVLYRNQANNTLSQNLLADVNPIERIESMGYEYGFLFNRLCKSDQEKIIASIKKQSKSDNILVKPDHNLTNGFFSPECIVFTHQKERKFAEAHLIAYLSEKRTNPIPKADQGPANSYIVLSCNDPTINSGAFTYDANSYVFNRISDGNWNGKYTFITFPITDDFIENSQKLSISSWNMSADQITGNCLHEMIDSALFR